MKREKRFDLEVNYQKLYYTPEEQRTRECPYCIYSAPEREFLQSRKDGSIAKKKFCPSCKQEISQFSFLHHHQEDRYAYGAWLYEYILSGGYDKIKWEDLKLRLSRYPAEADKFWRGFKERKKEWRAEHPTQYSIAKEYEEYSKTV